MRISAAEQNEIAEELIRRLLQINESKPRNLNAILYDIPENETTQVMDQVTLWNTSVLWSWIIQQWLLD